MYILNRDLSNSQLSEKYKDFVRKVQFLLNENDEDMSAHFGFTTKDFNKIMSCGKSFSLFNYQKFLDAMNVDLESVLNDAVDYNTILQQLRADRFYFPEIYTRAANGKKRTVINILDYIEKSMGTTYKTLLLRKFQLRPYHLSNPDELINNNFIVDLLHILKTSGFSDEQILKTGEQSYDSNKNTDLGRTFAKYKSPSELMPGIFEEHIDYYDRNFSYKIKKLNNDYCLLDVTQNNDVADSLGKEKIGSSLLSLYKTGVMSSFPKYIGLPNAEVKLLQCAHQNAPTCRYEMKFFKQPQPVFQH